VCHHNSWLYFGNVFRCFGFDGYCSWRIQGILRLLLQRQNMCSDWAVDFRRLFWRNKCWRRMLASPNIECLCSMFECSFVFGEHSNTRTRIYEKNSRTFEHWTSEHSNSTEQMKIPTSEHLKISEHSNIELLDIWTLANKRTSNISMFKKKRTLPNIRTCSTFGGSWLRQLMLMTCQ